MKTMLVHRCREPMHLINGIERISEPQLGAIMKTAYSILVAALAVASAAANATPFTTDEARAEAAKRNAAAEHAAALRAFPLDSEVIYVTDTESARRAAAKVNARLAHDARFAEMLAVGAGFKPTPITVTDTVSARAAAAQRGHQQELLADYADYVKMTALAHADAME